jgi:uncharacterized protein (TIGR03435 family)
VPTAVAVAIATVSVATQSQREATGDVRPAFEAATIKLAAPDAVRNRMMPTSANRLWIPGMTLTWLVYTAYGNGGYNTSMRVTGGPDWVNRTAFAVEAVALTDVTAQQQRLMLQTLLEERFALKLRHTTEPGEFLALTLDRSDGTLGPRVKKWDGTCPQVMPALAFPSARRPLQNIDGKLVVGPASAADDPAVPYCPTGYSAGGIRIDGATMATVAEVLSLPPGRALLGTVTQDHTGLTGRYTLELDYRFPPFRSAGGPQPEFAGPSLPTAVGEQWGLRLVPRKGALRVITVESAQLPAEN